MVQGFRFLGSESVYKELRNYPVLQLLCVMNSVGRTIWFLETPKEVPGIKAILSDSCFSQKSN